jgi:Mg2+/Co2+ transporter CorC
MGKIPQAGEKLLFNSLEFTIEKASAKMIVSLILKIK